MSDSTSTSIGRRCSVVSSVINPVKWTWSRSGTLQPLDCSMLHAQSPLSGKKSKQMMLSDWTGFQLWPNWTRSCPIYLWIVILYQPAISPFSVCKYSGNNSTEVSQTHTLDKNGSLYDPAGTESWNVQTSLDHLFYVRDSCSTSRNRSRTSNIVQQSSNQIPTIHQRHDKAK